MWRIISWATHQLMFQIATRVIGRKVHRKVHHLIYVFLESPRSSWTQPVTNHFEILWHVRLPASWIFTSTIYRAQGKDHFYSGRIGKRYVGLQHVIGENMVLRYDDSCFVSISHFPVSPPGKHCNHWSTWLLFTWYHYHQDKQFSYFGEIPSSLSIHRSLASERFIPYRSLYLYCFPS